MCSKLLGISCEALSLLSKECKSIGAFLRFYSSHATFVALILREKLLHKVHHCKYFTIYLLIFFLLFFFKLKFAILNLSSWSAKNVKFAYWQLKFSAFQLLFYRVLIICQLRLARFSWETIQGKLLLLCGWGVVLEETGCLGNDSFISQSCLLLLHAMPNNWIA